MDPWVITPQERARHTEQFNSLQPENGYVTGAQAKTFFMQSGLPPMVLAQIWGISDLNGDGRMDMNEFSIACKLINLKLKGMEIPKNLPPQMIAAPPNNLALGGMRPMQPGMHGMGMGMGMMGGQPGMGGMGGMGGMPGMMGQPRMPGMMGMMGQAPNAMMGMGMPGMANGGMMNTMPGMMGGAGMMMPGGGMMTSAAGMMPHTSVAGGMMPHTSVAGGMMSHNSGMMMMGGGHPAVAGVQPSVMGGGGGPGMMSGMASATATPPNAGTPAGSTGSGPHHQHGGGGGPAMIEWAIPQQRRAMATAQFQANDKARAGYLAAVQAKNLLLQTGLAQQTLATVWNLSDVDKDGKLSCEEYILAMHLCDLAMKGEPLPNQLPISMVPPSLRKHVTGGSTGVSTPGSVKSGTNEEALSPVSFEDKRRENWEAGQAELQKRKASLLEQQKREEDARKKKEKEEAEKREKQKKELERQRLEEWERSRKAELEEHRKRETENVIMLRAKKDSMAKELEAMKEKMTFLSENIVNTRTGVTDVKTFIDGMRSSRDTKMAELNAAKNQLKEQNQRLLQVTQEKAKLEAKNKVNQLKSKGELEVEITDFDLKKKEAEEKVKELRKLYATIKEEEENRRKESENNKKALNEYRDRLKKIIETCKALHEGFDERRREVRAEKQKKIRELTDPDHAWDASPVKEPEPVFGEPLSRQESQMSPVFDGPVSQPSVDFEDAMPATTAAPLSAGIDDGAAVDPFAASVGDGDVDASGDAAPASAADLSVSEYDQYRALYDYEARTEDELSFKYGDIILVHPGQAHEPGWLGGELNGKVGWFPETFAEKLGPDGAPEQALQPIAEVPENGSDSGSFQSQVQPAEVGEAAADAQAESVAVDVAADVAPQDAPVEAVEPAPAATDEVLAEPEDYVAVYDYNSGEPGDLIFAVGDLIQVTAKSGDWWTGTCQDQTGIFPYNYVEAAPKDKSGKKMEIATVIAPYTATSKEQLTLVQGQMVLVKKKTDTGWWQGELQGGKGKKRVVGWFPASYVKLLESAGGGGEAKKSSSSADAAAGENFTAIYDYAAQYEDELSFKAGDTILVTNKDDKDWWRGEVDGRSGVFPNTYVEPAN